MSKTSGSLKAKFMLALIAGALALGALVVVSWKQIRCTQLGGELIAKDNDPVGPKISPKTGVPKPTQTRHVCIGANGEVLF